MPDQPPTKPLIELTAALITTYLEHNQVEPQEVATLIKDVHGALHDAVWAAPRDVPPPVRVEEMREPEILPPQRPITRGKHPAVSIEASIPKHGDYIICLEDGKHYKSMKLPLRKKHGLSPEQYREKWGLPEDYPMVAPNYSARRKEIYRTKIAHIYDKKDGNKSDRR